MARDAKKAAGGQDGETANKGGRPAIEVSDDAVLRSGLLDLTEEETAFNLGISVDTLRRRFKAEPRLKELWDRGRAEGNRSLRRKMFAIATQEKVTGPSAHVLLFLARTRLGMKEVSGVEHTGKDGRPIEVKGAGVSGLLAAVQAAAATLAQKNEEDDGGTGGE